MASRLDVRRPDRGRRGGPARALCQDGSDPDGSTDVRCWSGAVGRSSPLPHAGIRAHPRGARSDSEAGRHDYTFVTDGIEAGLERARAAAGEKDVGIWGGANIVPEIPEGGSVGRDADPPRPSPPWWWSSPLRGPRPGTDRPGKNADDRDPKGNPSSIHHHEAREVTSLFFPWSRSAI